MSPKMNICFNFAQDGPLPQVVKWCKEVEEAGFKYIGMPDSQLLRREFCVSYTACVLNTSEAFFIPLVSNPLTRHPSVTAGGMLSLSELAPGRVSLGLGAGDSASHAIGLTQAKVETIRAYVQAVRGILKGEEVTWRGKSFKGRWNKWQPPTNIKIYITAMGPKTIKMAAQVADGIFFDEVPGISPENIQYCLDLARQGAEEVGRDPDELEYWWHLPVYLAENREAGLLPMGSMGIHFFVRGGFEGKRIPEELKAPLKRLYEEGYTLDTHGRIDEKAGQMARDLGVLDFLIDRMGGMVGTPEDVKQAVDRLYDMGIRNLAMLAIGDDKGGIAKAVGKAVLPHFS